MPGKPAPKAQISPKAAANLEKARAAALRKVGREEAQVDTSDTPAPVGVSGAKVRISRGDILDDAGTRYEQGVAGKTGRVSGAPYVATGGPNRGSVIQPVELEGTNTLVGVPTDRLSPVETGHARARVGGGSAAYREGWERIFGKSRRSSRAGA